MDLKTFVSETLRQIVEGVADAKQKIEASKSGASVNPAIGRARESTVEFDVALTVAQQQDDTTGAKAGAKAGVISIFQAQAGVDLETKTREQTQQVSRVRFSVLLAQPGDVRQPRKPRVRDTAGFERI